MTRIKHKISPNVIALVAAAIIVLGLFFTLSSFIDEKRLLSFDYMNNQFYDDEQIVDDVYTTNVSSEDSSSDSTSSSSVTSNLEHYIGYLEIPKLGFRRGFYNIDSALNTVEANIEVIKGSSMPDVENGNLIIAGHSGTGWKA